MEREQKGLTVETVGKKIKFEGHDFKSSGNLVITPDGISSDSDLSIHSRVDGKTTIQANNIHITGDKVYCHRDCEISAKETVKVVSSSFFNPGGRIEARDQEQRLSFNL